MNERVAGLRIPEKSIDIHVGRGRRKRSDAANFILGEDFRFDTTALESYAFASWEPVIFDAMVLAAGVEYADKIVKRSTRGWPRRISITVPVHETERWNDPEVSGALKDALEFLTVDFWQIRFVARSDEAPRPAQTILKLDVPTETILAFSDGMDSRAVAGIIGNKIGEKLVRVRVGTKTHDRPNGKQPFTSVPYIVTGSMPNREPSARSRGFKFSLITGIAAYLTDANEIAIPESGQGAIGPAIIGVGHIYPDYRNHPLFLMRMERVLRALLGKSARYVFPRIWNTKGETLREYVSVTSADDWKTTRSCWRENCWSSVDRKWRHCGVCAACMLRRLSVHAAGLSEEADTYVCSDMGAANLESAVDPNFKRLNNRYREYAIAGALHLDHMADLAAASERPVLKRHAVFLGPALGISAAEAERQLAEVMQKHADEWSAFLGSVGKNSFLRQWVRSE